MKTLYGIFIIVLVVLFSSCEKSNTFPPNTKVFGTISDSATGLPLNNVHITLKEGPNGTTHNQIVIREVYTNADGYYELKFYREQNDYWIDLDCAGYGSRGFFKIYGKGNKEMDFRLYP
jgi:hypothetical protein